MLAPLVLAAVTAERLAELGLARRNTRALLERGAFEASPGHYGLIVALHACWLGALWVQVRGASVSLPLLSAFLALQAARVWVLATLGRRWTTRIIILPGAPLVSTGPFRWLKHPNYAVVAAEVAVLPLAFGLPITAALFSILNVVLLAVRIRAEAIALAPLRHLSR